MKRGSVLVLVFWLVFFSVLGGAGYYIWTNYTKVPNEATKKLATSIIKYPTATTWNVEEAKNLCVQADGCAQPIKIFFETPNSWGQIYEYYVTYFINLKWKTNTNIVTSIPTSVVFTKDKCEVSVNNHSDIKYSMNIVCAK